MNAVLKLTCAWLLMQKSMDETLEFPIIADIGYLNSESLIKFISDASFVEISEDHIQFKLNTKRYQKKNRFGRSWRKLFLNFWKS